MQKRAAGGHTWAMLLIGFAGIGFAAYRRRKSDLPVGHSQMGADKGNPVRMGSNRGGAKFAALSAPVLAAR